jgi:hypothetical protein
MYVKSINLIPGDEWYEGLELTIEVEVGCFNMPCENCSAAVHVGLSSDTSLTCGYTPNNYQHYGRQDVDVDCGSTQLLKFYHTVSSADISNINEGVHRCCAFIPAGLPGMCYEQDSVSVVEEPISECIIDFYVCDQDLYPVAGASCFVGGKTATTNTGGICSVTLECGESYTATCNAPSGYTCDCGGCNCSDGPFNLTGDGYLSFFMKKVAASIVYCQQDFKVIDQNGEPVEYAIVGCEYRTDSTNFDVLGPAGTGTQRDGTVSTIQTISGRSYNFYISQFPAGYDFDIDGDSIFIDVIACRGEVVFRIKNLSVVPDPCNVNVCVQDQDGSNITGVAIYIKDVGTVSTKSDISMFGCTGNIGLVCGTSTTVTATVPSGYDAVKITETFTAVGNKTFILTIKESSIPTTCAGKTKIECDESPECYWWNSDNSCHDNPEQTDYPTLDITSDIDVIGGLDAYVDGVKAGSTPVTVSFTETDIGKEVSVTGVFAGVIGTKNKLVTLVAGSNTSNIELLMDNKEIIAGSSVAGILLINYM